MAVIDLPPGSGLPAWAWNSHEVVAAVVTAAALGSAIGGLAKRLARGPGTGHAAHAAVVAAAAATLAVWAVAAALASAAPRDGLFCFAPADWVVEAAPTCVERWPVWLLAAPLAVAVALGIAGLALVLSPRRRRRALASGALAAGIALFACLQPALIKPGVMEPGGITSVPDALVHLALDPVHAIGGIAVAAALLGIHRWWRSGD